MEYLTTPSGIDPLVHRAGQLKHYGTYTFDLMQTNWVCPTCGRPVSGPEPVINPLITYRTREDLEKWVVEAGRDAYEYAELPQCETCDEEALLQNLDYHVFHSGLRADLVIRWKPESGLEGCLWSTTRGYHPMPKLSKFDEMTFTRDALLRGAKAHRDSGEPEEAYQLLLEATQTIPGEPDLLRFIPWLHGHGKFSVSGEIATAHMEKRPKDPRGHYWLGQINVELVAQNVWPVNKLKEAVKRFEKALSLDPDYLDAELGLVNVDRLRGDNQAATSRLEALVDRKPDHPEALYTLGLLLLDQDPARALDCFERGESISPDDADYARGCARALLALDRYPEAQTAAARAKRLAPNDRRIDEVMSAALAGVSRG